MAPPLLLLIAAAILGWLSVGDRMSPLALSVVEVESSVGVPLWVPLAVLGGGLLLLRLFAGSPLPIAHPPRPLTRDHSGAAPEAAPRAGVPATAPAGAAPPADGVARAGAEWFAAVRAAVPAPCSDAMGRVRFDEGAGVPVTLVLTAVTPEQARRRVAAYAAWLGSIPAPPVARIRLVSSPDVEGPLHHLFRAELVRHVSPEDVKVVSSHTGADAVFARPDPRWAARG